MKSVASMPAIAGAQFRPLLRPSHNKSLKRSQSLFTAKPAERLRHLARRVPFMAFPGVGSQMSTFVRSYSRANLFRASSRKTSSAGYGSLTEPLTSPPPIGMERDASDGTLFGGIFNEDEMEQPGWTLPLGMAVFTAVLASFQVGYNSGVLNVPADVIISSLGLSTLEWSIVVSVFCIGGLIGSMSGGAFADRIGRKNFLIANNVAFIIGGLLEALAADFLVLSLGRLMIGVGCGSATVVVPMYLGEIAPANLRGSLGTMNQFSMVVGILVANLLGRPLGGVNSWRYLLGLCLLPALLQTMMAATLLESPLWLLQQGGAKYRVYAEEVLSSLRGTDEVDFDIECMLADAQPDEDDDEEDEERTMRSRQGSAGDIFADMDERTPLAPEKGSFSKKVGSHSATTASSAAAAHTADLRTSLWNPAYRRPLLIGFGLQLAQQFSGINAVFFYSTTFFASAHMSDPWLGSVLAAFVNMLATGLSIYLIERMGRRPLLLCSAAGMMVSCVGLTFALESNASASPPAWVGLASVGLVLVFVAFFEIGLGPIPWLIGSEIFPRAVRTQAMGVSSTINWLSNFAVGLSFPTITLMLGPLTFLPFGCVLAFVLVLSFVYVPETQGKSLEEIQEEFTRDADDSAADDVPHTTSAPPTIIISADTTTPASRLSAPWRTHRDADEPQATPIPECAEDDEKDTPSRSPVAEVPQYPMPDPIETVEANGRAASR